MPELDKWQKRQAEEYAAEHDVPYENAVKELFPPDPQPEAPEPEPEAPAAKSKTPAAK